MQARQINPVVLYLATPSELFVQPLRRLVQARMCQRNEGRSTAFATGVGLGADRPTTRFQKHLEATANEVVVTGDERMRSALIYGFDRNGFVPDALLFLDGRSQHDLPRGTFHLRITLGRNENVKILPWSRGLELPFHFVPDS
jgi:hypothetical protein